LQPRLTPIRRPGFGTRDPLAFVAAAAWFALNFVLWTVVESTIELFGWSLAMGAAYFTGFFGYLSYRDRAHDSDRHPCRQLGK